MLFNVIAVFVAVTFVTSVVGHHDHCPKFPGTANLNLEKFKEGKWYLAAKNVNEEEGNCVFYETKLTPEKIITKHVYNKKGDKITSNYPVEVDTEKGIVSFPTRQINDETLKYSIITDYDHYNINYRCREITHGHIEEFAYLNVRADDLSNLDKAIENAKKRLAEAGSKITELLPSKRENCPE